MILQATTLQTTQFNYKNGINQLVRIDDACWEEKEKH
jgi:hypothetical protein